MYGDGIKVVNADIEGLVLAALWMDALEADGDIDLLKDDLSALGITQNAKGHNMLVDGKSLIQNDLWGVAAIGSYDPISFQVWYAYLQDVAGLFAVEAALNFNVSDDFGIGVKGQFGSSSFKSEFKEAAAAVPVTDGKFAAGEASIKPFGAELSAGYVYFKAKDGGVSVSSFEDNGGFISAGEELIASQDFLTYSAYAGKNDYWFVKAGYKIPGSGLKLSADYLQGKFEKTGDNDGVKASEVVARANYAYNKHLDFTTWYSLVKVKGDNVISDDDDAKYNKAHTFRAQARYKF